MQSIHLKGLSGASEEQWLCIKTSFEEQWCSLVSQTMLKFNLLGTTETT